MFWDNDSETGPDRVGLFLKNVSSETLPVGGACVWEYSAGPNGRSVTKPVAGSLSLFAGIAAENIVAGGTGRIYCFGYYPAALVLNDVAQAISLGDILLPVAGQWYLARSAAGDGIRGLVLAAEAVATSNPAVQAARKVFIRCA